jgi:endosialidase-like protein
MKGRQIGFIAQDVQQVLPDVVLTANDADKTLGLKYDSLIPVLTKAIQELKSDNDKLKSDNGNLQAHVAADDAAIVAMKAKLGM